MQDYAGKQILINHGFISLAESAKSGKEICTVDTADADGRKYQLDCPSASVRRPSVVCGVRVRPQRERARSPLFAVLVDGRTTALAVIFFSSDRNDQMIHRKKKAALR